MLGDSRCLSFAMSLKQQARKLETTSHTKKLTGLICIISISVSVPWLKLLCSNPSNQMLMPPPAQETHKARNIPKQSRCYRKTIVPFQGFTHCMTGSRVLGPTGHMLYTKDQKGSRIVGTLVVTRVTQLEVHYQCCAKGAGEGKEWIAMSLF